AADVCVFVLAQGDKVRNCRGGDRLHRGEPFGRTAAHLVVLVLERGDEERQRGLRIRAEGAQAIKGGGVDRRPGLGLRHVQERAERVRTLRGQELDAEQRGVRVGLVPRHLRENGDHAVGRDLLIAQYIEGSVARAVVVVPEGREEVFVCLRATVGQHL